MHDREKVIRELKAARLFFEMGSNRADGVVGNLGCKSGVKYIDDALVLLKEQDDHIRILSSDLEDLQKEHQRLLDKKIPLITQGQEVVRCKDCVKKGNSYLCRFDRDLEEHGGHRTDADDDWFCADGERAVK